MCPGPLSHLAAVSTSSCLSIGFVAANNDDGIRIDSIVIEACGDHVPALLDHPIADVLVITLGATTTTYNNIPWNRVLAGSLEGLEGVAIVTTDTGSPHLLYIALTGLAVIPLLTCVSRLLLSARMRRALAVR